MPKVVLEAAKKQFPEGQLREAEREEEQGQLVYEAEFAVNGEEKEVDMTPEGKVVEVED